MYSPINLDYTAASCTAEPEMGHIKRDPQPSSFNNPAAGESLKPSQSPCTNMKDIMSSRMLPLLLLLGLSLLASGSSEADAEAGRSRRSLNFFPVQSGLRPYECFNGLCRRPCLGQPNRMCQVQDLTTGRCAECEHDFECHHRVLNPCCGGCFFVG